MKIVHKLLLLMGLAVLNGVIITVIAQIQLGNVTQRATDVSDNILPSVIALGAAEVQFAAARRELLSHVMETDPGKMRAIEQLFGKDFDAMQAELKRYEGMLYDDTDRTNFDELKAALDVWQPQVLKVMALSTAGQQAQALEHNRMYAAPLAVKAFAAFEKVVKYNDEVADKSRDVIKSTVTNATWTMNLVSAVMGGVVVVLGWLVVRSIRVPLEAMRSFVVRLGTSYDFTERLPVRNKDEVGESLIALNGLLDTLQGSLRELARVGQSVTDTATQLSSSSEELSTASQQVSSSASSMAAGVEEVTVSISHVADRASQCDQSARQAGEMAASGGQTVERTITSINQIATQVRSSAEQLVTLKDRTSSINAVVNVIKDIADQTNLLALNAAIEAARAGELGRGFAVVADEVRKLAERTSSSTHEIINTVSAIQNEAMQTVNVMQNTVQQVDQGVAQAQEASTAIQRIRDNADVVVDQVSEITSAMREQSTASSMMAQQVERVAQMSEESSSVAGTTANEGMRLRELSEQLDAAISRYRI